MHLLHETRDQDCYLAPSKHPHTCNKFRDVFIHLLSHIKWTPSEFREREKRERRERREREERERERERRGREKREREQREREPIIVNILQRIPLSYNPTVIILLLPLSRASLSSDTGQ